MTYQVLARRLRPQRFDDVVGQEHVTRTLQAAIRAGRIAHAFLFTGPRGVGKTTTARILAKALQCEKGLSPDPCNACSTCHEIAEGIAFDVLEIDGASHTQVDKMRDLMETVAHRPMKSRFKIYIIDEVHMLSSHSFNALLKTLEEPPAHVKFIFATTDPQKVLPTVLSRCQRYDLRRIGAGELVAHLESAARAEGRSLSPGALALLAREAEGSLRDAQSLLEQVLASGATTIDEAGVRDVIGGADRQLVVDVADGILAGDPGRCLASLRTLYAHGYDARRFCRDLLEHFRHLAILAATGDRSLIAGLPDTEVETIATQARLRSGDDLQRSFHLLLEADEALAVPSRTIEPQLVLEMAVLRLATLGPLVPLDELTRRLEALAGGSQRRPPASASGPSAPRATATPASSVVAGASDVRRLWDALLARVQEEKVALYLALAAARPLGIDGTRLRIGVENEVMRRDLNRKETLERLRTIAGAVAGRPLQVDIEPLPAEHVADTPAAQARRRTEETLADPLVQAAVEIFGAEVRGVRDRRSQ
ncbi:MAG TPA: DNA polymerase III subunit gamma/tau [Candidatus Eisenbacteria bacterium]|nr:DNA polymerase III subunit gamma/tau [Candidatus Eisenbacteria bacterium]